MSMKMNAYRLFKSEFPVTNRLLLVVSIGIALLGVKSAHATPNRNLNYTRVHLVGWLCLFSFAAEKLKFGCRTTGR